MQKTVVHTSCSAKQWWHICSNVHIEPYHVCTKISVPMCAMDFEVHSTSHMALHLGLVTEQNQRIKFELKKSEDVGRQVGRLKRRLESRLLFLHSLSRRRKNET